MCVELCVPVHSVFLHACLSLLMCCNLSPPAGPSLSALLWPPFVSFNATLCAAANKQTYILSQEKKKKKNNHKHKHTGAVGNERVIKFKSAKKHKQIGCDALTRLRPASARTLPNGAAVKKKTHVVILRRRRRSRNPKGIPRCNFG